MKNMLQLFNESRPKDPFSDYQAESKITQPLSTDTPRQPEEQKQPEVEILGSMKSPKNPFESGFQVIDADQPSRDTKKPRDTNKSADNDPFRSKNRKNEGVDTNPQSTELKAKEIEQIELSISTFGFNDEKVTICNNKLTFDPEA